MIDPKALDGTKRALYFVVSQSQTHAAEIKNLGRRIQSLQNVVIIRYNAQSRYLFPYRYLQLFNLISQEDNQVMQNLAEATARDSSAMKILRLH